MGNASSTLSNSPQEAAPSSTPESECPVAPEKREAIYNVYNQRVDEGKQSPFELFSEH